MTSLRSIETSRILYAVTRAGHMSFNRLDYWRETTDTRYVPMTNTQTNDQTSADYEHHVPVLLDHVLHYAAAQPGDTYLDLTAGYGGHASAIIGRTEHPQGAVLVDRDQNAIAVLTETFAEQGADIRQADFLAASRKLREEGRRFDIILADLGVSSPHLNHASRGFSIAADGPLDMRMDQRQELTAEIIVNTYPIDELARILKVYGEEPKAKRIAQDIVDYRQTSRITTTASLASIVSKAWPGHSRVHPATRTFQALRIAVNDELRQVEDSLPIWTELLNPGGRVLVISFHSLEDRIVKRAFQLAGGDRYDAELRILTKRPAVADATETVSNPRARSAKLRAAAKQT